MQSLLVHLRVWTPTIGWLQACQMVQWRTTAELQAAPAT